MKTAAVLPALGIGDALLMMIASQQLKLAGYAVTTFHSALPELSSWFPGHNLQPPASDLNAFDLIIAENDNSPAILELIQNHRQKLSIFYPTYRASKHAPLSSLDKVFNPNVPMAQNIAAAIAELLNLSTPSKENGITPPPACIHRANKNQVLIHPTSRVPAKNWKAAGYLKVARKLRERGLTPIFCVGPEERKAWSFVETEGFALAQVPDLNVLAFLVYESGFVIGNDSLMGHLASNLGIPTLIIADDEKRMRLWRPGWLEGKLVLPPSYLPNWRGLRNRWQNFISASGVLNSFDDLVRMF